MTDYQKLGAPIPLITDMQSASHSPLETSFNSQPHGEAEIHLENYDKTDSGDTAPPTICASPQHNTHQIAVNITVHRTLF